MWESGRSSHHLIQDGTQAPDICLSAIRLSSDLYIVDLCGQVNHVNLGQDLALASVVSRNCERAIESPSGRIVEQAVAHEVDNVFELHLGDINTVHSLHNPTWSHTLDKGLTQWIALVAFLRNDFDHTCTDTTGTWGVLADAKWSGLEDGRVNGFNLSWVLKVVVISSSQDHLWCHCLLGTDASSCFQLTILGPMSSPEVDELHCRPGSIMG
mmetsp:Transcript_66649/g.159304  ORF Transcript_66649/g.159304 Transcript_66649/m.159304 type:complete len:212 (-) Transcript_66649:682-1317(-)